MAESELWKMMKRELYERKAYRIEARSPAGICDVLWSGGSGYHKMGLVELKDDENEVRPQQGIFLRGIASTSGSAYVLARKAGLIYLLHPRAITLENKIKYEKAEMVWTNKPQWSQFWKIVSSELILPTG